MEQKKTIGDIISWAEIKSLDDLFEQVSYLNINSNLLDTNHNLDKAKEALKEWQKKVDNIKGDLSKMQDQIDYFNYKIKLATSPDRSEPADD